MHQTVASLTKALLGPATCYEKNVMLLTSRMHEIITATNEIKPVGELIFYII